MIINQMSITKKSKSDDDNDVMMVMMTMVMVVIMVTITMVALSGNQHHRCQQPSSNHHLAKCQSPLFRNRAVFFLPMHCNVLTPLYIVYGFLYFYRLAMFTLAFSKGPELRHLHIRVHQWHQSWSPSSPSPLSLISHLSEIDFIRT